MKKHIYIALTLFAFIFASCDKENIVTGVTLNKTKLSIPANGTGILEATILPEDAFGIVKWKSKNMDVATVEDGIVTGISEGTAQIEATVGSFTAICEVTVTTEITSINLNKSSIRLKIDSLQTLTATLLPEVSPAVASNLVWISTNPAVATVDQGGKITAISLGTANIVASIGTVTAFCSVTVYDFVPPSLNGSNYYLIFVDNSVIEIIGNAKIIADLRPDGANNNLFVWENTYNQGTNIGKSFYDFESNWLSFIVKGGLGWSGAAVNVRPSSELNKLKAISDDTSGKYYLHFAIKSTTSNSYAFKLGYGASAATLVLGTTAMENTSPFKDFTRNGQWQEIEVPMNYFKSKGLNYTNGMATTDVFAMLAGGTAGIKLELDAVFIYKK